MRRSTKSSLFPDVNVWLALTYKGHVHHAVRIALLPEPAELDRSFRRFTRSRLASPKGGADSYLAAFTSRAGLTLVTFDQALHRRVRRSVLLSVE